MLVLKSKRNGNGNNVLFIDASKEFKAGRNQNELTDENIQKIVETYKNRVDVEKYAHVADIQTEIIEKNDYNLNIPRYVDTSDEEVEIDIDSVRARIVEVQNQKQAVVDNINAMMTELGLGGI